MPINTSAPQSPPPIKHRRPLSLRVDKKRLSVSNLISLKITATLFVLSVIFSIIGSMAAMDLVRQSAVIEAEDLNHRITYQITTELKYYDIQGINRILSEHIDKKLIIFAELSGHNGLTLAGNSQTSTSSPTDHIINNPLKISGSQYESKLVIGFDIQSKVNRWRTTIIIGVSCLVSMSLIVTFFLIQIVIRQEVLVPLQKLTNTYNRQRETNDYLTYTQQKFSTQEFEELATSFDELTNKIKAQIATDPLTGLLNRTGIINILRKTIHHAQKTPPSIQAYYLDLDNFKQINDRLGHSAGDELLYLIGKRLSSIKIRGAYFSRLGGDEFLAIQVFHLQDSNTLFLLEALQNVFRNPFALQHHTCNISVSIGSSRYPEDNLSVEGLLNSADLALYAAKNRGKHAHVAFTHKLKQASQELTQDTKLFAQLFEPNRIKFSHQSWFDLSSLKLSGLENILSLYRPGGTLIIPERALKLATEQGLLSVLSQQSIKAACETLAQDKDLNYLIINISYEQIQADDISLIAKRHCLLYKIPHHKLLFGITKDNATSRQLVQQHLLALKTADFRLVLNNFTTGHSPLLSLRDLPIDLVRLDGMLLQNSKKNHVNKLFFQDIVSLCQHMGCQVLVEGISTKDELRIVQQAGCEFGQGDYLDQLHKGNDT